ncbi:MAG: response regulator [Anaerolineales bacterium]|nr:response regulator [Anaerolineales bacterium]
MMTENQTRQNLLALIIEDDPKLAAVFAAALQSANYTIEVIDEGQAAVKRLTAIKPDVVILDLHLPFVSGADLLQKIRADQRLAQTYVIVVTADLFRVEALRDQANIVLIKPVGFIRLQNIVAKLQATQMAQLVE